METTEDIKDDFSYPDQTETLEKLDDIFDITGCRDQVCDNLSSMVPDVRNDSSNDNTVLTMAYLNCGQSTEKKKEMNKNCYHLR